MLDYVPASLSLISGVLAFFFAKNGEHNKVSGVGWIMAALLVLAGLVGIYVIHDKNAETEKAQTAAAQAKKLAKEETDRSAMVAAKNSAMIMTLIGDFDLKQTISSANIYFEFDPDDKGNISPPAPGFIGPFPRLSAGEQGAYDILIGDSYTSFSFKTVDDTTLSLRNTEGGPEYKLRTGSISTPNSDDIQSKSENTEANWTAQQEPAPGGFVYSLSLPVDAPLRRVVYNIVSQDTLGFIRFEKGKISEDKLNKIETGFSQHPPTMVFYIAETKSNTPCNSYAHVPIQIVRRTEPLVWDDKEYDAFELKLTSKGFVADPCNNNPF